MEKIDCTRGTWDFCIPQIHHTFVFAAMLLRSSFPRDNPHAAYSAVVPPHYRLSDRTCLIFMCNPNQTNPTLSMGGQSWNFGILQCTVHGGDTVETQQKCAMEKVTWWSFRSTKHMVNREESWRVGEATCLLAHRCCPWQRSALLGSPDQTGPCRSCV